MIGFRGLGWRLLFCYAAMFQATFAGAFEIVATTGDASPDGNGELEFFALPALNDPGQVSFSSTLTDTNLGSNDNLAFFRHDGSGLVKILRTGELFDAFIVTNFVPTIAYLDNQGVVSGTAEVLFTGPVLYGFRGDGSALAYQVPPGSGSPSSLNGLTQLVASGYNYDGDLIYNGVYNGLFLELGLYRQLRGDVRETLVRIGDFAPGGGTFTNVGLGTTQNDVGDVATLATILQGGNEIESLLRIVNLSNSNLDLEVLVRQQDVAEDGSTTIENLRGPSVLIGNSQNVAFIADYSQPGVTRQGVFLAGDDGLQLIAPGLLPESTDETNNMRVFGISDEDVVGFTTEFGGGSDPESGVYVVDDSGPMLVALEDTLVPRGDRYFRAFPDNTSTMNELGQMVFMAQLSDTANGSESGRGLYFYSEPTGLVTIVETGDIIDGELVTDLGFSGTPLDLPNQFADASLSGLNNLGDVAFAYAFDSNTENGIAIWSFEPLAGDFNADGIVDLADYTVWRNNLGESDEGLINDAGDGMNGVDVGDYVLWKSRFGDVQTIGTAAATVPEPSTLMLICILAVLAKLAKI